MSKKDLTRLFDNAFTIPFDDEDKIVFMSDVHRGDGTYYDALLNNRNIFQQARVIIAVAGMEGALPSVIGGMVDVPVIAVPTSVGYGANFDGLAPLLAMLNSCASGISVVNIDNGFGAGYLASTINKLK
mgnify:CR=1 FL=1